MEGVGGGGKEGVGGRRTWGDERKIEEYTMFH